MRYQIRLSSVVATLALVASGNLLGCDDEPADGDADADGDGDGDVDSDSDGDGDGDGDCVSEACHAPPYAITSVSGTVRDETGAALPGTSSVVCVTTADASRCILGETDSSGRFGVAIPENLQSLIDVAVYFTSADRIPLTPYCRYSALCDGDVELCGPFVLYPAPASGATFPPVNTPMTADIRVEADDGAVLVLPAGAEVLPPIEAEQWMALTRFPLDEHQPCFVDPASPPLALYAVTPMDTFVIAPGTMVDPELRLAALDLPNDSGLEPGAEVDIYIAGGGHAADIDAHEGDWVQATTATVSGDGTRIQTAPGDGIGYLTWFGVYPR